MDKKQIQTDKAPQAIGAYSQAIATSSLVFISGQIPLTAEGKLNNVSFEDEVEQVIANLKAVCQQAGGDLDRVVKLTVYLTDLGTFGQLNEIMARHFTTPYPARAAVEVSGLPKGVRVEIEAIMACVV